MVQAANTGKCYYITHLRRFNGSGFRRILIQGDVIPTGMIIIKVLVKDSAQVPLIENNDVIQTVSAY